MNKSNEEYNSMDSAIGAIEVPEPNPLAPPEYRNISVNRQEAESSFFHLLHENLAKDDKEFIKKFFDPAALLPQETFHSRKTISDTSSQDEARIDTSWKVAISQEDGEQVDCVGEFPSRNVPLLNDEDSDDFRNESNAFRLWKAKYEQLKQFRKEHGHCSVPSHWPQNPPLAKWVKRQRYQYKLKMTGKRSPLSATREGLLKEIHFVWDSNAILWEERLSELKVFQKLHGHCNVPTKYNVNPQLAAWSKNQRRQYRLFCSKGSKYSSLTPERLRKLKEIQFVFDPRSEGKIGILPPQHTGRRQSYLGLQRSIGLPNTLP